MVEASKLLIQDHGTDVTPTIETIAKSVGNFHDRRDLLLQCLRLTLQAAETVDEDSSIRNVFLDAVKYTLNIKTGPAENASAFFSKCLAAMEEIEKRSTDLNNELQSQEFLGKEQGYVNMQRFQKNSLFKQHEALGCILASLSRTEFLGLQDLNKLSNAVSRMDRMDFYLLHFLPAFSAAFKRHGIGAREQADSLNQRFSTIKDDRRTTASEAFHNTLRLFWTVEYAQHFQPAKDHEQQSNACANVVKVSLEDNGLEFLLTVCSSVTRDPWRHPARKEMVALLLTDFPDYALEGDQCSSFFRTMLMEAFEAFAESWITNMPDSIRQLKNDEDDQRLTRITAIQEGTGDPQDDNLGPLHLESFLILMSYAFENRPDAADQFWEDTENNLYGFLQWASKRQTVPRVSAFCELLCSLADDPDGASAAHKFLLEESIPVGSSRTKRTPSMNYEQMFAELELYSRRVHEKAPTSNMVNRKVLPTDMNEAESPVMLSSYLQILSHLCRQGAETRDFIFNQTAIEFPRTILLLSSGPVPSYLRASVFAMLGALLTEMDWNRASIMWRTLDEWASNSHEVPKATSGSPTSRPIPTMTALQNTLSSIASSADQYDAFVCLLGSLLMETPAIDASGQLYNFPDDLGSTYRPPGITPYLDFACGQVFAKRVPEINDETQALVCSYHCLDMIVTGLETFHESYIAFLARTAARRDNAESTKAATAYAQKHPFSRLMQWLLSSELNKVLMKRLQAQVSDIESAYAASPLLSSIQRAIDVLNIVLALQPTYLNVVRPLIKDISQDRLLFGQSSIEESIFAHPETILNLCQYAASDHLDLALRSLSLLQKLSDSSKLNNQFLNLTNPGGRARRIVDLLGPNATPALKAVSLTLASKVQVNLRELESGFESADYLIKDGIFGFFNACLATQPEMANVAHILLGFKLLGEHLTLDDSSEDGTSVFDALIDFVENYPHGEDAGYALWLIRLKTAGMQTLHRLWGFPVSGDLTTSQLRRYRFLPIVFASQETVSETTLWDGRTLLDPEFWLNTSAETLAEVLDFRSMLYQYASNELRACAAQRATITLKQHLSTMMGKSIDAGGVTVNHPSILSLADFLEINVSFNVKLPETQYYTGFDPEAFKAESDDDHPELYALPEIREKLSYSKEQLLDQQRSSATQPDVEQIELEYEALIEHLLAQNRLLLARRAWGNALRHYAEMVIAVIELCPMEQSAKTQFILQMLQLILPKLDALVVEESDDTVELAKAADALMFALSIFPKEQKEQNRVDGLITDKLFQLFRTCVDGVLMSNSNASVRATLYSICSQYLARITTPTPSLESISKSPNDKSNTSNARALSNSMDTIRSSGQRLINILSDDAEDGSDTARLNALQLLSLLTSLARNEKSTYIVDSLVKANVLELLVDPLKRIAADFQDAEPGRKSLPTYLPFLTTNMLPSKRTPPHNLHIPQHAPSPNQPHPPRRQRNPRCRPPPRPQILAALPCRPRHRLFHTLTPSHHQ